MNTGDGRYLCGWQKGNRKVKVTMLWKRTAFGSASQATQAIWSDWKFAASGPVTLTQTVTYEDGDTFYAGTVSLSGGLQTVTQNTLYTDADTFYAGSVNRNISGVLYTDPDTFYTGTVTTRINGTLYTDSDTFYAGALSARISQSALYTDSDAFYAGTLAQALSGGLYEDADTFYGGVVQSNVTVSQPDLFDDGDTFYGGTVTDSNAAPTVVISGKQAREEWEARQKWRKQAETLFDEPAPVEAVPEVVQEAIEIDAILPRLYEPVESLAELVADARLLQLDEARALESAMAVKDVLAIAELAYLAEVAVQQEKDAIAAFLMFMD